MQQNHQPGTISLINNLETLDKLTNNPSAFKEQRNKILKIIQDKSFNPFELDSEEHTPLILCIGLEQSDIAIALIKSGLSRPFYVPKDDRQTALIFACSFSLSDVALALIKTTKSVPSQVSDYGDTALTIACANKLSDVALALIATDDSEPDHVNSDGNTALILACANGLQEVAIALINTGNSNPAQVNGSTNTALIYACANGLNDVALELIKTGQSNPEQINSQEGYTALILACKFKLSDVALELIKTNKSLPQQIGKDGNSARYFAEENQLTDVINALEPVLKDNYQIDVSLEGFDTATQDNKIISTYLDEYINNIVFKINDQYWLLSKDNIIRQTKDTNNLKYACLSAGDNDYDNGVNYSDDENIDKTTIYFSLSSLLPLRIVVKKKELDYIIHDPYSSKLYILESTGITLPSIISKAYLDGTTGGVSSDYCQPGKSAEVYRIIRASALCNTSVTNNNRPIIEEQKTTIQEQPQTNEITILFKAMPYKFKINANMTIGDLKSLLLNKLVELNKIPDINQNVRFVFGGKIYTQDSDLLTTISQNPVGITIQALTTPKTGGKKRLSKKKQTNKCKNSKKHYRKNTYKLKTKRIKNKISKRKL